MGIFSDTICRKHDSIKSKADIIREYADDIISITDKAIKDGMAMEKGLETKRERIKELEGLVQYYEKRIEELEKQLEVKNEISE